MQGSADFQEVGFTFLPSGDGWLGGQNYFRALFLALEARTDKVVSPVLFVGTLADTAGLPYPCNVRIVRDSVFDAWSIKSILNKLCKRLVGKPLVANAVVLRHGVRLLSHCKPSRSPKLKTLGWIPDFQHLHLPHLFPKAELDARTKSYLNLLRHCDLLIVSSKSAARDLARFSPPYADKARVLRFCAIRPTVDPSSQEDLASRYSLNGPFFYIPNQFWAHKNHICAVRALAELVEQHPNIKIICSGAIQDWRNPDSVVSLKAEVIERNLVENFILLGVIPYHHIAQLMQMAVAVINPSLFEGWSTTVEEAKALGAHMILSGIDVHREQCEQCEPGEAVFFDPMKPSELAACMQAAIASADCNSRSGKLEVALHRHNERMRAFAIDYERIVTELLSNRADSCC